MEANKNWISLDYIICIFFYSTVGEFIFSFASRLKASLCLNFCLHLNLNILLKHSFLGWSNGEIKLIKEEFQTFIRRNIYPSSTEVRHFIEKTKSSRSVPVIKSKLQHLIKLKTKK